MAQAKRVSALKRLQNTVSGNPRWEVSFEDGTKARTLPDSTLGYEVGESHVGAKVAVTFNPKGEITHLIVLEGRRDG